MSVYLYHPDYCRRATRLSELARSINRRLMDEQCTMPTEEWHELYEKVTKIESKIERGYYMQWSSLLQRSVGVPRPEGDFRLFSFREMRQIRNKIRRLLRDGLVPFLDYLDSDSGWCVGNLTFECWTNTLRWALGIFTNGLRDNKQVFLA